MIKVLQIRETPESKSDGLDANVQGIVKLFADDKDIEMLPVINYTVHHIPLLGQSYIDGREICNSIEQYNPDIVHVHGTYSFTLIVAVNAARKYKKPVILSSHFHPFWSLRRPLMGKLFFNVVTRNVIKHIDTILTINNEDTSIFKQYHNCVAKIPHWSKFPPEEDLPVKDKSKVLFVGRLAETNKGFDHLWHLPEGKYDIHCVGSGDIQLRSDMQKHLNISDGELHELYRKASLLVVPSRYEAFSYAALEALMCGTPIVCSERVRIADYLDGICGYRIFNYQDYDAFIKAVDETIGSHVDVNKVVDTFSPMRIKELYKKEYFRLIS